MTAVYIHLLPNSTKETTSPQLKLKMHQIAEVNIKAAFAQTLGCNPHAVQDNNWAHRAQWSSLMSGGCGKVKRAITQAYILNLNWF